MMFGSIVRTSLLLMIICGLLYPFIVTGIAKVTMPHQANGSLLYNEEKEVIGSELIGQQFKSPEFFHSRASSIEYNAAGSGSNNYAPSNDEMIARTKDTVTEWKKANPSLPTEQLPIDLVTNSGSGLDPHISHEAALAQIPRIARESGLSNEDLQKLVEKHTQGRELGLFGENKVNVLNLNLDLAEEIQ